MEYAELKVIEDTLGHDLPSIDRAFSRSLVDRAYRQALLHDAKTAFADEGVRFPDGAVVACHEVDLNDRHFFLPPMVSDPAPVDPERRLPGARNRPEIASDDPPLEGGVRPGVARPFLFGSSYPGISPNTGEPDQRW